MTPAISVRLRHPTGNRIPTPASVKRTKWLPRWATDGHCTRAIASSSRCHSRDSLTGRGRVANGCPLQWDLPSESASISPESTPVVAVPMKIWGVGGMSMAIVAKLGVWSTSPWSPEFPATPWTPSWFRPGLALVTCCFVWSVQYLNT